MLRTATIKVLAIFVLAFLCLNISGVVCLSYCASGVFAAADRPAATMLSEHCRRLKEDAEKNGTFAKAERTNASCCMMPTIMFAAPLEKRSSLTVNVLAAVPVEPPRTVLASAFVDAGKDLPPAVYRPPPLDRRGERILNCVIRI